MALTGPGNAGLYRWVDEDGNVHYTDTIPPDYTEQARTEFSKKGVPVHQVPRAKTLEEIRQERELERLRAQQRHLIEEQQVADRVLLRTFRNEGDLAVAKNEKLATIDVMIRVKENNIRLQEQRLTQLRAEAADMERSGKPVPQHLKDGIRSAESAISEAKAAIEERETQKAGIGLEFEQDLQRFRQLRDQGARALESTATQGMQPVFHEILTCEGDMACDRLWERAAGYIRAQETLEVQRSGAERILIATPPPSLGRSRLILSRIRDADGRGASIFLEYQCADSRPRSACHSPEMLRIVEDFATAATAGTRTANP
jgi:hypothetical protein